MIVGLRGRLLVLALLPPTLVAVLLSSGFMTYSIGSLEQGLRARGEALSRQIAATAEYAIFAGQRAALVAQADGALRIDPDLLGIAIFDADGVELARRGVVAVPELPAPVGVEGRYHGDRELLLVQPVMSTTLSVDDLYGGLESPRTEAPRLLGYVMVDMSLREIDRQQNRLIAVGILIALLASLLGGWLARQIARGVTVPLLMASEVVTKVGAGDTAARMNPDEAGALGSLATGINSMIERVAMTQDDLRRQIAEATLGLLSERDAAEEAVIAKSRFLAAASHDLRQPLQALSLFVSALAHSGVEKTEPKLVGHIQRSVESLQSLFDSILDISRMEQGAVTPSVGSFALGDLLVRMSVDLSVVAEDKGLRFKLRAVPILVRSDEKIVERILLNLIGNALRYTSTGGVLVGCRRRSGMARVEVWDTGEGIPEHALGQVFEDYTQMGNPERDLDKGQGLGLAICRRLAGLLEIPIGVHSRTGRGSMFWIELPLSQPEAAVIAPADPIALPEQATDGGKLSGTVLLVEGTAAAREIMGQSITGWGYRVLLADSREEALRVCRENGSAPDLAICNIGLRGLASGIALAQELRLGAEQMRVVMVTAEVTGEAQVAAARAGIVLINEKVPPGRLRAALQNLLTGGG